MTATRTGLMDMLRLVPQGGPAILNASVTNLCNATCDFCNFAHDKGFVTDRRSMDATRFAESLALMNVYGRVANVLLDSAIPNLDGVRIIRDKISRQDIAKMVGASREMVSRVMKDFEEQGFIESRDDGSLIVKERRLKPR